VKTLRSCAKRFGGLAVTNLPGASRSLNPAQAAAYTVLSAMLANNFSTSTCIAIFELIKFMYFSSTLSYPHKEFFIPRPPRTKYNPLPPRTHSSAGSRIRPANAGTRNPPG